MFLFRTFPEIHCENDLLAQELKCSVDYVHLGNSAFKLERGKFNWWDAARSCMDLGTQLATIDSEQELNAISQYLNQLGFGPDEAVWFSSFGIKSGAWISLANSKIQTYFKWATAEPNDSGSAENCLGIKFSSGTWFMHDLNCFKEYSYLCEVIHKKTENFEFTRSDRNRSLSVVV
ncbi:C-type lectin 37Db-like [Drosophila obscura]|uniref:C-type lectin 37Db-like n=1 Tax=Drosophila obscura TaxID=7282 RepID=UPI001BB26F7C|nr:C-type lectin 37Db-like [Drosophila obscura]